MEKQRKAALDLNGKYIMFFLLVLAILANLKSIFVDCDIDTEYAVAMSYRMLQGDGMLRQMWEPHQTSAFLCTLLMKPFVVLTGGTTGVVVYLQTMGVLIHGALVWIFYSFMKRRVDLNTARLMSIFFLAVRPKDIVFPEYTNMQIWFSVLLFMTLVYYLENQNRKLWLVISSAMLCLEVLSYPSCVLVMLVVVGILWIYSDTRMKDILVFAGSCAVAAVIYVGYFVLKLGGVETLLQTIKYIVSGDSSHQSGSGRMGFFFWENLLVSLLWPGASLALGFGINKLLSRKDTGITEKQSRGRSLLIAFVIAIIGLVLRLFYMTSRMAHISLYVVVIILAFVLLKKCEACERKMISVGLAVSLASTIATLLLTNLDLSSTLMYPVLGVMMAFVPLHSIRQQEAVFFKKVIYYDAMLLFCLLCLFQRGVTVKTLGGFANPLKIGGIVKTGPELGILADYMGANIRNTSLAEWESFVQEGENIMIVEKEGTSAIGYLYGNSGVGAPSTIRTPTWDEQLLEYWELYPDKQPDVVAVQCWYGELSVDENSWVMQWLEAEYGAESVQDGTFWRFYRRNIY